MSLGPRAFLKKVGFDFAKKPSSLDSAYLNLFDDDSKNEIRAAWTSMHLFAGGPSVLYTHPQTTKQAALLFSHDRNRAIATFSWVNSVLNRLQPSTLLEVGCGAGFQLRYIRECFPNIQLSGVDKCLNLLGCIPIELNLDLIHGDYLTLNLESYDVVLCDFGWDNSDIKTSSAPHTVGQLEGHTYCPICAGEMQLFYQKMLSAFQSQIQLNGTLLLTGRFPQVANHVAFFDALNALELDAEHHGSQVLKVKNLDGATEKLHAYVIRNGNQITERLDVATVLEW